jgi:DNA-binding response OmpR family regulator
MQILVVEDEQQIADALSEVLGVEGYHVRKCASVETAEKLIVDGVAEPRLIILDLNLPGMNGLKAIPLFRSLRYTGPILVLTGRTETSVKVEALDAGADDYLLKPFSIKELLARVRALLRRSEDESSASLKSSRSQIRLPKHITLGTATFERHERRIVGDDVVVELTEREAHLLEVLAEGSGRAVSREMLLDEVWSDSTLSHNTVDVHVKNLRKKIEPVSHIFLIETVRGVGYRLSVS